MKNIFKISILFFLLGSICSCTNDKDPVATSSSQFELRQDLTVVPPTMFSEANKTETFSKLNWDRSANGGVASSADYFIYISDHDADPNFENGVESKVGLDLTPDARKAILTVDNLNVMMNQLASFNCGPMNIDIRIKSKLGIASNAIYQYSNPITVNVTGYPKKSFILSFAKDTDNPATAAKIVSSNFQHMDDYEGFMYLEPGNYKFYKPNACGEFSSPTVYGISGGNSGTLVQGGTTSFNVAATGHYFIKADMVTGTYAITPFNNTSASNVFGIFGVATKTIGFANTIPMTYDVATKKWSVTISLINGKKFSFKTGNTTSAVALVGAGTALLTGTNKLTLFTGATIDTQGSIKAPGDYVSDTTKTKYDIVVDVSSPRQYTFTMTVNPN